MQEIEAAAAEVAASFAMRTTGDSDGTIDLEMRVDWWHALRLFHAGVIEVVRDGDGYVTRVVPANGSLVDEYCP